MYFKLAIRNLRGSFRDYTIYFFTLVFGVCIFYTFNAIKSQSILMELDEMQKNAFNLADQFIGSVSVFIAFVLGFLIIYANNYLIKRRKKEFGIYMTLGVEKGSLSKLVFLETFIIGLLSLVVGIILGVLLSQGMSVFTAKMFRVSFTKFEFVFSSSSFIKTILCFALIYIVVLLFNSISIRKIKLVDLLIASKKNEKKTIKNMWASVILFIISIIMIGYAYYKILSEGIGTLSFNIDGVAIIFGAVGTFFFFYSLTGFLLKLVKLNKKFYLQDLNMFVAKQISSKINTTFISMSFICLMLFIAICTFSGGMGINSAINAEMKDLTQFDATMWNNNGINIVKGLKDYNIDLKNYVDEYSSSVMYESNTKYSDFLSTKAIKKEKDYYPITNDTNISVMKISDFNSVLKMLNKRTIDLKEDKYLAFSNVDDFMPKINESLEKGVKINLNGKNLTPQNNKVMNVTTANGLMKGDILVFVVNDNLVKNLKINQSIVNFNLKNKKKLESIEEKIREYNKKIKDKDIIHCMSKEEMISNSVGIGAIASYLGIYIGIVFLITASVVLAIQQLSESTDNIERYRLLKNIGVDKKIINKAIFMQVAMYFFIPLSLAIIHSVVGLKIASHIASIFGSSKIMQNIIITAVVTILIYGGYFIATYIGVKKNINDKY
ncbi:ABC transporter permease [Clostridium baratii]|uniref:ABC transporter permease n=1 Tax=Clostridium baratii TaxID=1561 RepID=UPI0029426EE7|nr:ABC transporter permease [Clostridium baratii]